MASASVRMYRQGLGDCFLITLPKKSGNAYILIDCGVLKGTEDSQQKMKAVAADILKTTGGKLDVLVVTHEHWDHVSGFVQAQDELKQLTVGEVWVAWTEDPNDELANTLGKRRAMALKAVQGAASRLAVSTDPGAMRNATRINSLLNFYGGLAAAGQPTTADAFTWAKARAGDKIKFLRPGESFTVPGVDSVRVYVLGPPTDVKLLKKSDPTKSNPEVYQLTAGASDLGFLAAVSDSELANSQHPFESFFRVTDAEAEAEPLFYDTYQNANDEWRQIEHDWLGSAGRVALQLDSDTNNTSLALAFELTPSKRVLLFPGDAQVGNWMSWGALEWTVTKNKQTRVVNAKDLLARTVLYKVGHHASHNATMRAQGLELMESRELVAMIPVNRVTAKKMEWNMPFPSLFTRLKDKTQGRIIDAELGIEEPADVPAAAWKKFKTKVKEGANWMEYTVTR
ncbi:MAG: MBL fold metallo-hydrolase [Gemmatimonadaceae bacterium]